MSCQENEIIIENKYEAYGELLRSLDEEFLGYEYADRIGAELGMPCKDTQIAALESHYGCCLIDEPTLDWVAEWHKEYGSGSK